MGLGRRKIPLEDQQRWVFNKMVEAYEARPAYPQELVAALHATLPSETARVLDVGAGIGHLALPLAALGCEVTALEPAQRMLEALQARAEARRLRVTGVHATAEKLPFDSGASFDLIVVADALHFLDAELSGSALSRVLAQGGTLALITCELGDTPFMRGVVRLMEEAAPRRPRDVSQHAVQFLKTAQVELVDELRFAHELPVDHETLARILRSISFIGPAMNAARFSAFMQNVRALPETPAWARTFTLRLAKRRKACV